ncbi:2-hydroxy-1,4-benzoquinone reductase [bioreactor metagenome]|uniref:2-hydroxy-1,4-benzoquinone reductase n=1 Tax=bioreactor metagenome TaxID=1076179 RepID=A0A645DF23_9ZZZZ|nr:NADPH-dependent FMN reductase [Christensenella sp.]
MEEKRIVAVVGSLRKGSYNLQLAQKAKEIVGERAIFEIIDYSDVPLMNQDIEYPAPEAVRRVRDAVKSANGVWIFTPEYNHSYPGVLKNLIDWLSRPVSKEERQVLSRKPVAISGTSTGMGATLTAQDLLVMMLSMLNANVMNFPRLTIPNIAQQTDDTGKLSLTTSLPYLEKQADTFLKFLDSVK